jgi:membrane-bound lytic murein transglycosylase D
MEERVSMKASARPLSRLWPLVAVVAVLAGCASVGEPVAPHPEPRIEAAAAPAPAPAAAASSPGAAASAVASGSAPAPIDPLRPSVRIDPHDTSAHTDLWQRIRRGFAMPDLDTPLVTSSEQHFATRPDYVARMMGRAGRYLFHIVEEVERRGMPTELALLPFIESAFNPQAMSVAKASGMWQFIPSTGRDYDLRQNIFRDDRRDVLASTRAALDYLQRLHDMFDDWQLALAAYNWGEGSVQRAIARNRRAGKPTGYLSLAMPRETRWYLPKLQAVKNIVARPDAYSLVLPALENHPYFLVLPIERDLDVDLAARLAELPLDEFRSLNPQLNRPVILAAGTPQVLLPYDNANLFVRNYEEHRGPFATWTAWVAPKTLRPADAAKHVGMSEEQLRDVNRIPPKVLVAGGSTLVVPRPASRVEDVSEHLAHNATMALTPERGALRKVSFKVGRKGSSVSAVARQYGVSPALVAEWNRVGAQAAFKAGQAVVVYLPARAAVTKSRPAARAAAPSRATRSAGTGRRQHR